MNILIAGGTGFIGRHIVDRLSQKHRVVVLSRHENKGSKAEFRQGDVTKPETLKNVGDGIDVVIQCVQFPNHPIQNYKKGFTYEAYDAQGTINICKALEGSSVKRIIYFSGAGTAAHREEPWFKAKWKAEEAIRNSGLEFVILRPSWVYGPDDRSLNKFVGFAKRLPFIPVLGNGKARVAPVFVEDLAEICERSLDFPKKAHEAVEVGGPQILTMNDIQKSLLHFFNKKKPLIHSPLWFMRGVGAIFQALLPTPPLTAEAIDFLNMDCPVSSRAVEDLFGIKMTALEDALATYATK